MKTKQEMIIKSVYMPKEYWEAVDKEAEQKDISSNRIIRHLIKSKLLKNKNIRCGGGRT